MHLHPVHICTIFALYILYRWLPQPGANPVLKVFGALGTLLLVVLSVYRRMDFVIEPRVLVFMLHMGITIFTLWSWRKSFIPLHFQVAFSVLTIVLWSLAIFLF